MISKKMERFRADSGSSTELACLFQLFPLFCFVSFKYKLYPAVDLQHRAFLQTNDTKISNRDDSNVSVCELFCSIFNERAGLMSSSGSGSVGEQRY